MRPEVIPASDSLARSCMLSVNLLDGLIQSWVELEFRTNANDLDHDRRVFTVDTSEVQSGNL